MMRVLDRRYGWQLRLVNRYVALSWLLSCWYAAGQFFRRPGSRPFWMIEKPKGATRAAQSLPAELVGVAQRLMSLLATIVELGADEA